MIYVSLGYGVGCMGGERGRGPDGACPAVVVIPKAIHLSVASVLVAGCHLHTMTLVAGMAVATLLTLLQVESVTDDSKSMTLHQYLEVGEHE